MRQLFIFLVFFIPMLVTIPSFAVQPPTKNEVYIAQTILKLNGLYNDQIDGIAGPNTKWAIVQYQQNKSLPVTGRLSDSLLEILQNKVKSPNNIDHSPIFATKEEVNILRHDFEFAKTLFRDFKDSFDETSDDIDAHFIANFRDLVQVFFLIFGLIVAIIAIIAPKLLEHIESRIGRDAEEKINELIDASKRKLKIDSEIYDKKSEAQIYTMLSSHAEDLYKDLKRTRNPELYDSYLNFAIALARSGYTSVKQLIERKGLKERDLLYIAGLNNIVFYLASRSDQADKKQAEEPLCILKRIVSEIEKDDPNNKNLWKLKETLLWAAFKLEEKDIAETKGTIESMLTDAPDTKLKEIILKRYTEAVVLPIKQSTGENLNSIDLYE